MNVLFIFPNFDLCGYKPIAISQLISLMKKQGHKVRLFDTSFYDTKNIIQNRFWIDNKIIGEQLLDFIPVDTSQYGFDKIEADIDSIFIGLLNEFKPDIVMASVLSPEALLTFHLFELVKKYNEDIPTLMGGNHCYADPDGAITNKFTNMICIGDGEVPLIELLNRLSEGRSYDEIKGLWVKGRNDHVTRNLLNQYYTNLDELPYLDYDEYDRRQLYRVFCGKVYRSGDYTVTRGCYEKCGYCITETANILNSNKYPLRRCISAERIIDELIYLKNRYDLNFFRFQDSSFLSVSIDWLKVFSDLYERKLGLPFCIDVSPQTVTFEKARLLKKMNCVSVSVGVESGNEDFRYKTLNKTVRDKSILEAFSHLNRFEMRTVSFMLIGFPFETRADINDSIMMNRECHVTSPGISSFYPFKGTRLRKLSIAHNLFNPDIEPDGVPLFNRGTPLLYNPRITQDDYQGIIRTFILYSKLPEAMFGEIKKAEKFDDNGNEAFRNLQAYYKEKFLQPI